jgi:hypothetical protein
VDNADAVVTRLAGDFPSLSRETVTRQVGEAAESVKLFGISDAEGTELVERLARCHLEALRDLQSERG